ncbi:MAG: ABC transporter permease, partial [Gammaproteobacteria bacterium]|nr:ABC transporter permease [Gammaproteobacteria bacterium]
MYTIWQDIKFSIRSLAKSPGLTAIVITCLALGIGANTAIYSIVRGVIVDPLPFADSDGIMQLDAVGTSGPFANQSSPMPYLNYEILAQQQDFLEEMGGVFFSTYALNLETETEALTGAAMTHEVFSVLRAGPLHGRLFVQEDVDESVAIISEGLWRRRFGADTNLIGDTITIDGVARQVIGIVPQASRFPAGSDVWVPLNTTGFSDIDRRVGRFVAFGRLQEGVSLTQARDRLARITEITKERYPSMNSTIKLAIVPLKERLLFLPGGINLEQSVLVLLLAVSLLFAIACVNVANLLLVRAQKQSRNFAVRTAIGASNGRVLKLLITEALLLGFTGGLIGVALAFYSMPVIIAAAPPVLPAFKPLSVDLSVLFATTCVSVVALIAIAFIQYLRVSRQNPVDTLKEGGNKGTMSSRVTSLVQGGLIITQIALSLAMLVTAGLMIKSFAAIQSVNPGFDVKNIYTLQANVPESWGGDLSQYTAFYSQVLDQ